jgi:class 3 adenylate cyclase
MVETVQLGRDAMERHAWAEAMDVFLAADRSERLGPDDLERLGTAAWWAGKPDESTEALERSFAAYEAGGRASDAMAAEGDQAAADRDLRAARAVFERLGAKLDLARVDALLGETASAGPARATRRVTKTFMFTDIVTSTDLVALIGDDAWAELLKWHDRELRSAFANHGGEEVNHTGDGFFAAFERAGDAIDCGVDIQRRLVKHRHEHGFAPTVRIGLHTAEATREGTDYRGRGVHVAARIGAAAASEEILVSSAALGATSSSRFGLSEPRQLTLKGVEGPVEVRSVEWRYA